MRFGKSAAAFALFALCRLFISPCAGANEPSDVIWPTKGWQTSTPETQGMDSVALAKLVDAVGSRRQDSLLVIRHGRIVAEAYYAPFQAGVRHDLRSITKSVISTLTGVEIENGFLDSVDDKIVDLFSEKPIANIDDRKKKMTVQNLLDMTSGIQWKEDRYTPDETIMQMYRTPDHAQFVLDQPMSDEPGSRFYYDGGNPYLLSALITKKTFKSAYDFAKYQLFEPLGISDARWARTDAQGVTDGESGLYLEPRDMAKLGYLYLHRGLWEGKEIIPASWVDRAAQGKIEARDGFHYANLWWSLPEKHAFMALGRHSQLILVLPDLDIVTVMTGTMEDDEYYPKAALIDAIAAAVKSDGPLAPNPEGDSILSESVKRAATEPTNFAPQAPETAKAISGRTYGLAGNDLGVTTLTLRLTEPRPSWEYTVAGKDQTITRFAGLIGLDGRFRKSPAAAHGIDAVRGRWVDDHTFEVERRILGHGETERWLLRFDGESLEASYENTDGVRGRVRGQALPADGG
jgi:CubicO group peptidase (beta-lactamase class C family)